MPEKAEKVYSFDGGSGCVWAFFPILVGSSLRAGVILLLSCTMNYMYGVHEFIVLNISEGVLFIYSVD